MSDNMENSLFTLVTEHTMHNYQQFCNIIGKIVWYFIGNVKTSFMLDNFAYLQESTLDLIKVDQSNVIFRYTTYNNRIV